MGIVVIASIRSRKQVVVETVRNLYAVPRREISGKQCVLRALLIIHAADDLSVVAMKSVAVSDLSERVLSRRQLISNFDCGRAEQRRVDRVNRIAVRIPSAVFERSPQVDLAAGIARG